MMKMHSGNWAISRRDRTSKMTVCDDSERSLEVAALQGGGENGVCLPSLIVGNFTKLQIGESIEVSEVVHQTVVEVNETGTEAAAGTAITMMLRCARAVEEIIHLDIDRAFYFDIFTSDHVSAFKGICATP